MFVYSRNRSKQDFVLFWGSHYCVLYCVLYCVVRICKPHNWTAGSEEVWCGNMGTIEVIRSRIRAHLVYPNQSSVLFWSTRRSVGFPVSWVLSVLGRRWETLRRKPSPFLNAMTTPALTTLFLQRRKYLVICSPETQAPHCIYKLDLWKNIRILKIMCLWI